MDNAMDDKSMEVDRYLASHGVLDKDGKVSGSVRVGMAFMNLRSAGLAELIRYRNVLFWLMEVMDCGEAYMQYDHTTDLVDAGVMDLDGYIVVEDLDTARPYRQYSKVPKHPALINVATAGHMAKWEYRTWIFYLADAVDQKIASLDFGHHYSPRLCCS